MQSGVSALQHRVGSANGAPAKLAANNDKGGTA
jgi:hypothetical protein